MKKSAGAAAAAAVAVLVVAGPAGAATSHRSHQKPDPRVAQLTKVNRQLQKQLRNMTILRNEAKSALATANGQIGSLQPQNASLQRQVSQLTIARDAALAEVASLQAQLAAIPTPLAVAVDRSGGRSFTAKLYSAISASRTRMGSSFRRLRWTTWSAMSARRPTAI